MGRAPALVWCPDCKGWTNCRSINASTDWGSRTNERQYEQDGICYHQRFRQCAECSGVFYTAELTHDELCSLLRDRAKLADANAKLDAIRKGLRAKVK